MADKTTGDLVTAADWNNQPRGVLAYAQTTTNVGSIVGSMVTLTTLANVNFPEDRYYRITGSWRSFSSTVAADRIRVELLSPPGVIRAQVVIRMNGISIEEGGGTITATFSIATTTNGPVTLRAARHSGSGTVTAIASTDSPLSLTVEDIGSV